LADLCLFAQVLNNARFEVDMSAYPTIERIHANCLNIPALEQAAPVNQPDAV
jgi:maleylpyruvate isomerase